jgi:hypothetical protein
MSNINTASPELFAHSGDVERAVAAQGDEAARRHLAAGRPVYRGDPRHPGMLVRANPDGTEQLVRVEPDGKIAVVRDL